MVKAGFVQIDATSAITKIIVFQYNPETLVRRLEGVATATAGTAGGVASETAAGGVSAGATAAGGGVLGVGAAGGITVGAGIPVGASASIGGGSAVSGGASAGAAAGAPAVRTAEPRETVSFTLALDAADNLERGDPVTQQTGLLPIISALELLLYPTSGTLTLWVSGNRRVLPVHISEMLFQEQAFDRALNPIRAEVFVNLQVLKDADFPPDSRGRALWDAHFAVLQQLASLLTAGTLGDLGLSGI